jgi:hypothetical protein
MATNLAFVSAEAKWIQNKPLKKSFAFRSVNFYGRALRAKTLENRFRPQHTTKRSSQAELFSRA